jgi:hypothetical protein
MQRHHGREEREDIRLNPRLLARLDLNRPLATVIARRLHEDLRIRLTPAFLKVPIDTLEKILPHVRRVELAGLDHGASGNADRGGKPEVVTQELRRFFT